MKWKEALTWHVPVIAAGLLAIGIYLVAPDVWYINVPTYVFVVAGGVAAGLWVGHLAWDEAFIFLILYIDAILGVACVVKKMWKN